MASLADQIIDISDGMREEFREAFNIFDKDNDGFISIKELGDFMRNAG